MVNTNSTLQRVIEKKKKKRWLQVTKKNYLSISGKSMTLTAMAIWTRMNSRCLRLRCLKRLVKTSMTSQKNHSKKSMRWQTPTIMALSRSMRSTSSSKSLLNFERDGDALQVDDESKVTHTPCDFDGGHRRGSSGMSL